MSFESTSTEDVALGNTMYLNHGPFRYAPAQQLCIQLHEGN
jgi:hypothetical protein